MPDVSASIVSYGPYAFGIVSALILWRFVVAPELSATRLTAATLAAAANTLESASIRLERIEQSIRDHNDARDTHGGFRHDAPIPCAPSASRPPPGAATAHLRGPAA